MRIEYTLIPKQAATVKDTIISPYIFQIDDAEVTIEINEHKINKLKIAFCGIGYDLSSLGKQTKIILHEKELRYSAYKICSYISNRIYTESGTDAFDCNEFIDNDAPEIYPENLKEQEDTACSDIFRSHIFRFVQSIENFVDLEGWHSEGYKYEKAYTAYADGLRANSIFTRYVQTYKAIEVFFGKNIQGNELTRQISEVTSKYDDKLDYNRIDELRVLRNRCEHPHQSKGHLSSSDIRHIKEVEQSLPDLMMVAKTLLNHFKDS